FSKTSEGFASSFGLCRQAGLENYLKDGVLLFRPEQVGIVALHTGDFNGRVSKISYYGAYLLLELSALENDDEKIFIRTGTDTGVHTGDMISFEIAVK